MKKLALLLTIVCSFSANNVTIVDIATLNRLVPTGTNVIFFAAVPSGTTSTPKKLQLTEAALEAITGKSFLTTNELVAGSNITLVSSNGTIYISSSGGGGGATINSTDGVLPYRVNSSSFGDSPIKYTAGTPDILDAAWTGLGAVLKGKGFVSAVTSVNITSDNNVYDWNGYSAVRITSDSGTATARTFGISTPAGGANLNGNFLVLTLASGACELPASGSPATAKQVLRSDWTPSVGDSLYLWYSSADDSWFEIARSYAALGSGNAPTNTMISSNGLANYLVMYYSPTGGTASPFLVSSSNISGVGTLTASAATITTINNTTLNGVTVYATIIYAGNVYATNIGASFITVTNLTVVGTNVPSITMTNGSYQTVITANTNQSMTYTIQLPTNTFQGLVKLVTNGTTMTITQAVDGTDFLSPSGAATLTNKTFDSAAAGNVLKELRSIKLQFPRTIDGTGCTYANTNDFTTNTFMVARFSGSAATNANYCRFAFRVPKDIDTSVDLTASLSIRLTAADTAAHTYHVGLLSIANSASTGGSAANFVALTVSADASGASGDIESVNDTTLTNWKSNITANQWCLVELRRDGANDASSVASDLLELELTYTVSQ